MENNQDKKLPQFPDSYWREEVTLPRFDELKEDLKVDAVIVGGGITGITAAYLLVKEGLKVALMEAGTLLNGTTAHTTAKITAQHNLIYDEFINHLGKSKARMYYEANIEALKFIEKTIDEHQMDCDFSKVDTYLYAATEKYAQKLEKEYQAYQKLNIEGSLLDHIPFDIKIKNALSMKNQAQFHPLKYLMRLVEFIKDNGGLIFEGTTAVNIDKNGSETTVLTRNGHRVTGKHILSCSHFPFYEGTGFYFTRMYAERSYILAVKTKDKYPGGTYLSVDKPTRSLRSAKFNGEEIILVAGEAHKAGQGQDMMKHYKALEQFAQEVFDVDQILYRWSTQDLTTLDKLPYIGPITSNNPNVLIATGYRKWGMTSGTAAAQLLKDIVTKKENRFRSLYEPSRFIADPSLKHFFKENLDVAKHLIKGKLEIPKKDINELAKDEGGAVLINGEHKGAYKDSEGNVHLVDTTCTHMGCEVHWNNGDRTWDCPCHGSRFSYTGEVVEGPAEKPLQKGDYSLLDNLTSDDSGY